MSLFVTDDFLTLMASNFYFNLGRFFYHSYDAVCSGFYIESMLFLFGKSIDIGLKTNFM